MPLGALRASQRALGSPFPPFWGSGEPFSRGWKVRKSSKGIQSFPGKSETEILRNLGFPGGVDSRGVADSTLRITNN